MKDKRNAGRATYSSESIGRRRRPKKWGDKDDKNSAGKFQSKEFGMQITLDEKKNTRGAIRFRGKCWLKLTRRSPIRWARLKNILDEMWIYFAGLSTGTERIYIQDELH